MSLFWDNGLTESALSGGYLHCGGYAPKGRVDLILGMDVGIAEVLTLWITASWQLHLKGLRGSYPGDGISERPNPLCSRIATAAC